MMVGYQLFDSGGQAREMMLDPRTLFGTEAAKGLSHEIVANA